MEAAIQEQLYNLMTGKTVIAIAHRLSTIAAMDRLVIMDKGRIVEEGTPQRAAQARRAVCRPVGAPVGRLPGRGGGGGGVGLSWSELDPDRPAIGERQRAGERWILARWPER